MPEQNFRYISFLTFSETVILKEHQKGRNPV